MATWLEADPSITAACDVESTRYTLSAIEAKNHPTEKDRVVVAATNGRVLAIGEMAGHVDHVEHFGDKKLECDVAIVPASIFPKTKKELTAVSKAHGNRQCIRFDEANQQWAAPAYDRTAQTVDGRFPRCTDVLPHVDGSWLRLMIDPWLLLELAKACNCNYEHGRGLTLLIDIDRIERQQIKLNLPDREKLYADVTQCLATALRSSEEQQKLHPQVAIVTNPFGGDTHLYAADDEDLAEFAEKDWIVSIVSRDQSPGELTDKIMSKIEWITRETHFHVTGTIPVVGNGRIGAIMPLAPERKQERHDVETYERVRKLAIDAEQARALKKTAAQPESGPASENPETEPEPEPEPEPEKPDGRRDPIAALEALLS
jgi:hypothetical protein